ncbi:MAG: class I SAM-dependent methyltransferase [Planctomycetota bacterium]
MSKVGGKQLGTVQETLLIPLWARAAEARRATEFGVQPILRDPRAEEIVAGIDYPFEEFEKHTKITRTVACVLATIFDAWVRRFLSEHPNGTVVEVGAGLDTRFERLDNGHVHWFDLDLPDAMEVRRQFFRESPRRTFLAGSVLEPDWIERVKATRAPAYLFLAEAVLLYFREEDVRQLFTMIADHFPGSLFAFDSCCVWARDNSRNFEAVKLTGAEFRWGIDEIRTVESWDPRFQVLEVDSVLNHFRDRFPWILRVLTYLFPKLRYLFSVNLLRLGS